MGNGAVQIGMAGRDACQGQGIGTALLRAALELADRWLELRRLELEVYADNAPAVRLYPKCGFSVEGAFWRAARVTDVRAVLTFLHASDFFERWAVIPVSMVVLVLGVVTAWIR